MTLLYRDKTTEKVIETLKLNDYIEMVDCNVTKLNKKMRSMVRLKLSVVEKSMPEFYAKYCLKEVRIQKINTLLC